VLKSSPILSKSSGFSYALGRALASGDSDFAAQLVDSLGDSFEFAEPCRLGVSRNALVVAQGHWDRSLFRSALSKLEQDDTRMTTSERVTWAHVLDTTSLAALPRATVPYFDPSPAIFHRPDLFVADSASAHLRLQECAAKSTKSEVKFWNGHAAKMLRDVDATPVAIESASRTLALMRLRRQSAISAVNLKEEAVSVLADVVSRALAFAHRPVTEKQKTVGELRVAEQQLAHAMLIASAFARIESCQPITEGAVNRLGRAQQIDATVGDFFPAGRDACAFVFTTGVGLVLSLAPGDMLSFPYVGLPLPRVCSETGIVLVAFVSENEKGYISINQAAWSNPIGNLLVGDGRALTPARVSAMLTLMQARQSRMAASKDSETESDSGK
jgi:hypothetical protein